MIFRKRHLFEKLRISNIQHNRRLVSLEKAENNNLIKSVDLHFLFLLTYNKRKRIDFFASTVTTISLPPTVFAAKDLSDCCFRILLLNFLLFFFLSSSP